MKHIAFAVMLLSSALSAEAEDHTVELEVHNAGALVGWHFSHYDGPNSPITLSETPHISNFTRIWAMDDTTGRMERYKTFDKTKQLGPGTYIFDVSDWSDDCSIEARITVDGTVLFSTSSIAIPQGTDRSKLKNWHSWMGPGVRITDDREIAFELK